MPSPNRTAIPRARRTTDTALCVMGNSLALYNPPTRVAEEFAMIDCISGGRLIAGFPVGSPVTNVTGTVNLGGGFASVYSQIIISPAQPLSSQGYVPGSMATVGIPAVTAPLLGDPFDGARVYDSRLRDLLIQNNDWQRKIFYVLAYIAGGGAVSGISPQDYLQSMDVSLDPIDVGQEDQLSPLGDYH